MGGWRGLTYMVDIVIVCRGRMRSSGLEVRVNFLGLMEMNYGYFIAV